MPKNKFICDCNAIHPESIEETKHHMIRDKQLSNIYKFCKAMGNSTRIKILWSLKANELCVCDIANILSMTKSAISHQLKILKEYNLVTANRKGKEIFYCLADDQIKIIIDMIAIHIMESN